MELIEEYISTAIELEMLNTPHIKNADVKLNNKLAKRLRNIAQTLAKESSQPSEFAKLLEHDNANVRIWAAHHMLEVFEHNDVQTHKALAVIRKSAETSVGEKMWLNKWLRTHPDDRLSVDN